MKYLLWPLALIFSLVSRLRVKLYTWRLLRSEAVSASVLAIGNLTAGGTGKTPLVAHLIEKLNQLGFKTAIVSRGYRAQLKGPVKVDPRRDHAVELFGDEPTWLAQQLPKTSVFVGRDRVAASWAAIADADPQIIVADDGFQHLRLQRQQNIVVLDATEPRWHYWPLPAGRAREGFRALRRAQLVVISKVNWAAPEQLQWLREKVQRVAPHLMVAEFEYRIGSFSRLYPRVAELQSSGQIIRTDFAEEQGLAVCGIGRPEMFRRGLEDFGIRVVAEKFYADHYAYSNQSLREMLEVCRQKNLKKIFVTEKDAVKLKGLDLEVLSDLEVWVSELKVYAKTDLTSWYENFFRKIT